MDIDHVAIGVEVHVPYFLEEGRAPNDLLGMEQKVLEQLKFLRREIQSLIVHHCDVTQPIQGDRAITQHLEAFRTASSEKRSDAGHELVELKRLREIIIGAGVQSADYVFGCVTRREHQDRSGPALSSELAATWKPFFFGSTTSSRMAS